MLLRFLHGYLLYRHLFMQTFIASARRYFIFSCCLSIYRPSLTQSYPNSVTNFSWSLVNPSSIRVISLEKILQFHTAFSFIYASNFCSTPVLHYAHRETDHHAFLFWHIGDFTHIFIFRIQSKKGNLIPVKLAL